MNETRPNDRNAVSNNEGSNKPSVREAETRKETVNGSISPNGPSKQFFGLLLAVLLVFTGTVNSLAAKWADSIDLDGNGLHFNHPFFQADVMFVGEMSCMVAFMITLIIQRYNWRKNRIGKVYSNSVENGAIRDEVYGNESDKLSEISEIPTIPRFNCFLFAIPAFCDVVATSLQYLGLTMTSVSSYQMLRGSVIVFTGIMSVIFLKVRLRVYHWVGIAFVVIGLVIVGVADFIFGGGDTTTTSTTTVVIGNGLIILAQVVVSIQMVSEQKLLSDSEIPALYAVGLEGIFGFIILSILMVAMYFIKVPDWISPSGRLEDALDAFYEMSINGQLVGALCCTIVSIAFFNFAGISVTKFMSATTRMVLDSIRTVLIWGISIPLFKSKFIPLQLLGFFFLILGMFVYNDILIGPLVRKTNFYRKNFESREMESTSL